MFADTASGRSSHALPTGRTRIGNAALVAGFPHRESTRRDHRSALLFAAGMAWPFVTQIVTLPSPSPSFSGSAAVCARRARDRSHARLATSLRVSLVSEPPPVRPALVISPSIVTWGAAWSVLVPYALNHLHMGAGRGYGPGGAAAAGGPRGTTAYGWLEHRFPWRD